MPSPSHSRGREKGGGEEGMSYDVSARMSETIVSSDRALR